MAASLQNWVSEHKLATVAGLWASAIGVSLAMSSRRAPPLKPSLKIIHARLHAQAITLGVLAGAATLHYLDTKNILAIDIKKILADLDPVSVSCFEDFQSVNDWY